jgi:hypothetical protein
LPTRAKRVFQVPPALKYCWVATAQEPPGTCGSTETETVDLGFQKCVGDQCNPQGRDRIAPANCESFLYLIFDRIGGGRGRVRASGF